MLKDLPVTITLGALVFLLVLMFGALFSVLHVTLPGMIVIGVAAAFALVMLERWPNR